MIIWSGHEQLVADALGRFDLECWKEYVFETEVPVRLPAGLGGQELPPFDEPPYRYRVNFGDYIGRLAVGGADLVVRSAKLDEAGFDALLQQLTARIASLPFDIGSPTFVPFSRDALDDRSRLYHALLYLRWAMRYTQPSLAESWSLIIADPHRVLVREERWTEPWRARDVTPRTLERIASHPETWVPVESASPVGQTALAALLVDAGGMRHFPEQVAEVVAETCVDTPENRFAKYFLGMAHELVERAADVLSAPGLSADPDLVDVARELASELKMMEVADFLGEVGEMQQFPAHSQVLQKRAGYRELMVHYQALVLAARYPISARDLARIVETKSASTLYEYWCFFEMAEALERMYGRPSLSRAHVVGDELRVDLSHGFGFEYPGGVSLWFNRTFSRARAKSPSYSVTLRPDITLQVGSVLHLFDAKFRVDRWDVPAVAAAVEDAEVDAVEAADHAGVATRGWWKNADIHKMHAYKDAIGSGTGGAPLDVRTVWVLYPGSEFVFYDEGDGRGVGAIPLAVGVDGQTGLRERLEGLLGDESEPSMEIIAESSEGVVIRRADGSYTLATFATGRIASLRFRIPDPIFQKMPYTDWKPVEEPYDAAPWLEAHGIESE